MTIRRSPGGIRFRSRETIAAQPRRVQLSLLEEPLLL
jgi:hypothetical protein